LIEADLSVGNVKVQSRVSSRKICGEQSGIKTTLSPGTSVFPVSIIPNMLQTLLFIIDAVYFHTVNVTRYPLSTIQGVNTSKIISTMNYPKYTNSQQNAL